MESLGTIGKRHAPLFSVGWEIRAVIFLRPVCKVSISSEGSQEGAYLLNVLDCQAGKNT